MIPLGLPFGTRHAVECLNCSGHTKFARNSAFVRWLGADLHREHGAVRWPTKKRIRRALRRRARQAGKAMCEER